MSNSYVGNLTPYNIYIDESDYVYNINPNDEKKINVVYGVGGESSAISESSVSVYSLQKADVFDFGVVIYFIFNTYEHLFDSSEDSEFLKANKLCIIYGIENSLNLLINHMIFNTPDIETLYNLHPIFWKYTDNIEFIFKVLKFDNVNNKEEIFKLDNVKVDSSNILNSSWILDFDDDLKSIWDCFKELQVRFNRYTLKNLN